MKLSLNLVLILTISFLTSCGGYKFQKSANATSPSQNITAKSVNSSTPLNQVRVMTNFPTDNKYVIIGKCYGSSYKGAIIGGDGSYKAFKRLKNCACLNGGNAVVITDKEEKISTFNSVPVFGSDPAALPSQSVITNPKQMKVKFTGYVIVLQQPKSE